MLTFFSIPNGIGEDYRFCSVEKSIANCCQRKLGKVHFIAAIGESFERDSSPLVVLFLFQIPPKITTTLLLSILSYLQKVRSAISPVFPTVALRKRVSFPGNSSSKRVSLHGKTCFVSRCFGVSFPGKRCFISRCPTAPNHETNRHTFTTNRLK